MTLIAEELRIFCHYLEMLEVVLCIKEGHIVTQMPLFDGFADHYVWGCEAVWPRKLIRMSFVCYVS
jgi:hypothetical protein